MSVVVGNPCGRRPLDRPGHRRKGKIKKYGQGTLWEYVNWIELIQDSAQWKNFVVLVVSFGVSYQYRIPWSAEIAIPDQKLTCARNCIKGFRYRFPSELSGQSLSWWIWKGWQSTVVRISRQTARKSTLCWNVKPCTVVEIDRRFRGAYCLHHQRDVSIAQLVEECTHHWNVGRFLPDCTA
jgi:hypothetical protein